MFIIIFIVVVVLTCGLFRPNCSCKENKSICVKNGRSSDPEFSATSRELSTSWDQDIAMFGRLDSMCQWRNTLQIFRQTSLIMLNCLWHYNNFQVNQRLLVHFYSTRNIYYSTHPAKMTDSVYHLNTAISNYGHITRQILAQ